MRWKQFFTPVQSMDPEEAKAFMAGRGQDEFTLLDVRQPKEYEEEHLPGAKLIPIGELDRRLDEVEPGKPVLTYCAVGGRSRVAAQMLAGKGFDQVINLTGGIKAWNDPVAVGPVDLGLDLFTGDEPVEETLIAAYALEAGLRDFYLSMVNRVEVEGVKSLFRKLSEVEELHQQRLVEEYVRVTGEEINRHTFEAERVGQAVEGGLTTDEYLSRFRPDWSKPSAAVGLAMSIEAQALDLYTRAASRSGDEQGQEALKRLAEEERSHLDRLADWMDRL
jgi:rhodanese-related sulfurtransferase/rubrerythrin